MDLMTPSHNIPLIVYGHESMSFFPIFKNFLKKFYRLGIFSCCSGNLQRGSIVLMGSGNSTPSFRPPKGLRCTQPLWPGDYKGMSQRGAFRYLRGPVIGGLLAKSTDNADRKFMGSLSRQAMQLVANFQKMGERFVHPFPLVGETSPSPFDNFFKIGCALTGLFLLLDPGQNR